MQIGIKALEDSFSLQKEKQPFIHCISNSSERFREVVPNYYSNIIISKSIYNCSELTFKADALLIGLDALDEEKINIIEKSIRVARGKDIPIILDINNIGSSFLSREIALRFINRYRINIIIGKEEEYKILILNEKNNISNEQSYKSLINKKNFKFNLRNFSKIHNIYLVVINEDYYLTDGFSEFIIKREVGDKNRFSFKESILSELISIGVASASSNEKIIINLLIAIITMAVSEKKAEQRIKEVDKEEKILREYLIDEISSIEVCELNSFEKIYYLFTR